MHILVSATGGINWDTTRAAVVGSAAFALGTHDFGTGTAELQARCPGCRRVLPTALMHLDHILSQAQHQQALLAADAEAVLLNKDAPHRTSTTYGAVINGGVVTTMKLATTRNPGAAVGGGHGPMRFSARQQSQPYRRAVAVGQVLHALAAWTNDLENLQFLCMCCNTSKGDRLFAQAFPHRQPSPLR